MINIAEDFAGFGAADEAFDPADGDESGAAGDGIDAMAEAGVVKDDGSGGFFGDAFAEGGFEDEFTALVFGGIVEEDGEGDIGAGGEGLEMGDGGVVVGAVEHAFAVSGEHDTGDAAGFGPGFEMGVVHEVLHRELEGGDGLFGGGGELLVVFSFFPGTGGAGAVFPGEILDAADPVDELGGLEEVFDAGEHDLFRMIARRSALREF